MDGISIYYCSTCDTRQGFFYKWDEIDDEKEYNCGVCGNEEVEHIEDKNCECWHLEGAI